MSKSKVKVIARCTAYLLVAVLAVASLPGFGAQNPDDMLPAANAAKARGILEEAVAALGGSAYVNIRDLDCKGRIGQFDSGSGEAVGSVEGRFLRQYPDRSRTEVTGKNYITNIYSLEVDTKGRVALVNTPENAWSLGKNGVTDLGPEAVADYKEQLKNDLNMLLRYHLHEDGLLLRYAGTDVVDLKQVNWVEITDRERRTLRAAVDAKTHLPVRTVYVARDPVTNSRIETVRVFSNYHTLDGVSIPFQTALIVNGGQVSQTFYSACQLNTGLSPDLFTRAGLDAQFHNKK